MPSWDVIARVKCIDEITHSLTNPHKPSRVRFKTFKIYLVRGELRCQCGTWVKHTAGEVELSQKDYLKACIHMRALYRNGDVTVEYNEGQTSWAASGPMFTVKLTELGRQHFGWIYATGSL